MQLDLHLLMPEFLVAGAALAVVATEVLLPPGRRARATSATALIGLLAALAWIVKDWVQDVQGAAMKVVGTDGALVTAWTVDAFSLFTRGLAAAGGVLLVLLSI